ncbi:MAG: hypothetical protein V4696_06220 [Pseudomonadota bacterium]
MQTIKMERAWTYRTPQVTIEYGAGDHEVTDAIAKAYADAHEEKADGGRTTKSRAPRVADAAEE